MASMDAVECSLKYSGAGMAFLLAAAACGVVLAVWLPVSWPLRAALLFYVLATSARACVELVRPRAVRLRLERRIDVLEAQGWIAGEVRDGSFVMPWLTIVRWRPAGARLDRSLLLLPGMAPADEMRKIRVILRWG